MGQLTYLLDEICAGVEIYYSGRTGGQYLKTAFVLCDDYTELTSKLFLLTDDPSWSDQKASGSYKNYHDVLNDVQGVFKQKRVTELNVGFVQIERKTLKSAQKVNFSRTATPADKPMCD